MARTTGPLMSLGASGSVASTLTFAHWKGRPYVRQLVTPSNPQSQKQTYTRAMMSFLSQTWKNMDAGSQASWTDLAKQGNFSPFNAFVQFNMKRWTQSLTPGQEPIKQGGEANAVLGTLTPVGGVGQISGSQVITTINQGWGLVFSVFQHTAGTAPVNATRLILDLTGLADGDSVNFQINNLPPKTYDLSVRTFDIDMDAISAAVSHASLVVT